ncbi:hypothetical protein AWB70_05631 [Caballeronia cordobensis]|uniref:Uncharacterized protein n=1 Tax=Caballeronia cordobensis TaxID=1353886 RepID=A0A158J0U0_CABCO|nr:hypothetical protein AWB70_05631 [Caballeronia cordobensis]
MLRLTLDATSEIGKKSSLPGCFSATRKIYSIAPMKSGSPTINCRAVLSKPFDCIVIIRSYPMAECRR